VVGAPIGAGIGDLIESDRWSAVILNPGRPAGSAGNAAIGLTAALRF
jgi:hypothetical protein